MKNSPSHPGAAYSPRYQHTCSSFRRCADTGTGAALTLNRRGATPLGHRVGIDGVAFLSHYLGHYFDTHLCKNSNTKIMKHPGRTGVLTCREGVILTHRDIVACASRFLKKPYSSYVLNELQIDSWGGYRFDVVAVTPNSGKLTIVEAKASRSDFLRGKDKLSDYMNFCHRLFVAAPKGLLRADELPEGCGLLEVYESHVCRQNTWPRWRTMDADKYTRVLSRMMQKVLTQEDRESEMDRWRFDDWMRRYYAELCRVVDSERPLVAAG